MAQGGESWTTIESDPGVFTELIEEMGVKGVQVEELYALDANELRRLQPVLGLIFLFKWRAENDPRPVEAEGRSNVFFAKQIINNACATQAILSILMNSHAVHLGPELTQLREFSQHFPAEMKGLAISNSEPIRTAHNSFAPPQPMLIDESVLPDKDDDAFHFISYLPVDGVLYELDGLKEGPIRLAECTEDDWLDKVCPLIGQRIERYASSEIRFNLMAVIGSRVDALQGQLQQLQQRKAALEAVICGGTPPPPAQQPSSTQQASSTQQPSSIPSIAPIPSSVEEAQGELATIDMQQRGLEDALAAEAQKRANWRDENIRRKHNYIPFIFNMLRMLAEKNKLQSLIDKARREK